ncbi:type IV-A pilus assembly ATPase PilB [Permianibacter fluminis]|uniref:type IV-A pilus assembly ATPase PilB n=1 Tax=Permianibacter fluminis TaxID=2738515 RepID=UPI0015555351|nr:type IV-A pilus assembly ATPase PilB [Permianibacter fluminis]
MSTPGTKMALGGLPRRLVTDGILEEGIAQEALAQAVKTKQPFVSYVVQNKLAKAHVLANIASQEFGAPLFDIEAMDQDLIPKELVEEAIIRQHRTMPLFKRGNRLFVAISDPTNLEALDKVRFHTGMSIEGILVEDDKLGRAIDKLLDAKDAGSFEGMDEDLDNLDIQGGDEEPAGDDGQGADDAPIVRFINKLLMDAIKKGASDLHFEPYEKEYRVRFRVDGVLKEIAKPPVNLSSRLAARLKVMSRLDIAERRVPQDGRIKLKLSKNKSIDFRVSTLPTLWGEKVVMRILDSSSAKLGIDALGYEPVQKQAFMDAIAKPQGMVLVTGPTGSGKTVSLYTAVNILNDEETNISTAEDPVEINLPGVNQVQVNPRAGLTFPMALRAFLRQDPDVVLVGEIRDLETAEIGIKAAQTGHLVLSTLHTNSAPETLTRLINMGVAPFNIATTVHLIIAQRLARRLCSHCKKPVKLPPEALIQEGFREEEVATLTLYEPVGCDNCNKGYKGRVGVYEVMPVTDAISRIVMSGGNAIDIADQMRKEGIKDLRESGLEKVRQGVSSLAEINRITSD